MTEASCCRNFSGVIVRALPVESLSPQFRKDSAREAFLVRLKAVFAKRRKKTFCLAETAQDLGHEPQHRLRGARGNCSDVSPAQAFLRFRMTGRASCSCRHTLSIKEISAQLGFENQFHFSRAFKRVHGLPLSKVNRAT